MNVLHSEQKIKELHEMVLCSLLANFTAELELTPFTDRLSWMEHAAIKKEALLAPCISQLVLRVRYIGERGV
jgi:hypothetical protein